MGNLLLTTPHPYREICKQAENPQGHWKLFLVLHASPCSCEHFGPAAALA